MFYFKVYRNVLFMGASATPYRIEKALQNSTPCWTERAWVVQEFALSSTAQICFDQTKLSHKQYHSYCFVDFMLEVCPRSRDLSGLLWGIWFPPGHGSHFLRLPACPLQGILVLARNAAHSHTGNLHDKVFAFLGLVREEEAREIVVDYNVPFWVTCARATYASAKHNRHEWEFLDRRFARLSVLEFASWAGDRSPSFPSWAVNFSQLTWQTPYECFSTSFGWPGSKDHYNVSLSSDLRCLTTYGVIFASVATSFTLYPRLDPDSDDSWSTNGKFDNNYFTSITGFTARDSVPAAQAALLAELTNMALQNRETIAAGVLDSSEVQAEKLSSLVLQLEKQQEHLHILTHSPSLAIFASSLHQMGMLALRPAMLSQGTPLSSCVVLSGLQCLGIMRTVGYFGGSYTFVE
ncbi:hypothetical protein LTR56_023310 [Elasticomyces elasticus]|nr:hypothetical protein LTR56_023310 [Elasticomyces elasticus]KAK4908826.1 hypothetical protein LTR49_022330 [Elasticomyces elasticus]KAK5743901.1 hypothetical protein LTS12_023665 [Elasticomyces elasticus]